MGSGAKVFAAEAPSWSYRASRSPDHPRRAQAQKYFKLVDYPCEFTIKVIGFRCRHVPLHRRRRGQAS